MEPLDTADGNVTIQLLVEKVGDLSENLNMELLYGPAILLSVSQKIKNRYSNENLYMNVHCSSTHKIKG